LGNLRIGKIVADVVWEEDFPDAEGKRALFVKARIEICKTHFDAK
jgi:hypothetical protein